MSAKHALVTGAAGGIGCAVSDTLRSHGWQVTGIDLRPSCVTELTTAEWPILQADLADPPALAQAVASARSVRPITAVVHAAAVQPIGAVGKLGLDEWESCLRVNVLALEQIVTICIDDLRRARGAVVAVTSVHARATTRDMVAYATSKAALEGWIRAAALDLAPEVRVNAVAPGAIRTPMLMGGLLRRPADGAVDQALSLLAARTPLGSIGEPRQLANLIAALLDDDITGFVTGTVFTADGGALLRLGTE